MDVIIMLLVGGFLLKLLTSVTHNPTVKYCRNCEQNQWSYDGGKTCGKCGR